jgi:hypothetical protein
MTIAVCAERRIVQPTLAHAKRPAGGSRKEPTMSESDDIFAPDPIPEEKLVEARILAWSIFEYIRIDMMHKQSTQPHNPKTRYGYVKLDCEWSKFPDREVWINAVMEALAKMREGRL